MIRPIGPLHNSWVFQHLARSSRAEPPSPAVEPQQEALERRKRLDAQQQEFHGGHTKAQAIVPYVLRFRPPP
jgi:hypothetical protein